VPEKLTEADLKPMLAKPGRPTISMLICWPAWFAQESDGHVHAVSRAGAQGLMQLMPGRRRIWACRTLLRPAKHSGWNRVSECPAHEVPRQLAAGIGRVQRGAGCGRSLAWDSAVSRDARLRGAGDSRIQPPCRGAACGRIARCAIACRGVVLCGAALTRCAFFMKSPGSSESGSTQPGSMESCFEIEQKPDRGRRCCAGSDRADLVRRGRIHFDWHVFGQQLRMADWRKMAIALACIYAGYVVRSVRWVWLLRHKKKLSPLSLLGRR
jgi:hypothetical protein